MVNLVKSQDWVTRCTRFAYKMLRDYNITMFYMTEFYYKDLCHQVIGICFDVYNEFDYGYREKFYEDIIYDRFLENIMHQEKLIF